MLLKIQNGDRVRPETVNISNPDWKAEALERCSHAFQRFFTDEKTGEQQLLAGKNAIFVSIAIKAASDASGFGGDRRDIHKTTCRSGDGFTMASTWNRFLIIPGTCIPIM